MLTTSYPVYSGRRFILSTGTPPSHESARVAAAVQRARQEEREHLARELHAVLGGELTAARLQVACLKSRLATQPQDIGRRLDDLDDLDAMLRTGLALQRRIIDGLEPAMLRSLGLTDALRTMARELAGRSDIRMKIELDE